ncbi:hypothetical protein THRCLA_11642 [Thraustotheca clavata]|uniref:Cilia- and flagella-associated protein 300 n=1 Tax=Thraustotheca clavata TaxID=74557 RepID=A0A1V9Y765_9STRA|nr:hypothetical protein THRCLA_11642 [Thraustotheca clavata]
MAEYDFDVLPTNVPEWELGEVKLKLMQWNLDQHSVVKRFRISCRFDPNDEITFLRSFFESPVVRAHISLPSTLGSSLDMLEFQRLRTSITSLSFFDKLENESDLVSTGGYLRKCMDEVYDHCTVSECLREMMANPESEYCHLFTPDEQKELIYQIFKRLVIGGAMCQPDDKLEPYLEITKRIYKALAAVRKLPDAQPPLEVYSYAYLLTCNAKGNFGFFPKDSPFNSLIVAVDPKKQSVQCWYCPFVPFW